MNINIIGVPVNYGCDIDGVQFGPNELRKLGLVDALSNNGNKVFDFGNIYVPTYTDESKFKWHDKMKYLNPIVDITRNLAHAVFNSLHSDCFPFVIGGDHSLGMGSIAGASKHFKELAVIWVDAHGDINTPDTSPTCNIHGMPLAASMGYGYNMTTNLYYEGIKVKPRNVYIIGARDLDEGEIKLAEETGLNLYTMEIVRQRGLDTILQEVIETIKTSGVDGVHLSYDIDCLDSSLVPGTGTKVDNGFTIGEGKEILKSLLKTGFVTSMDFVEFNPKIDDEDKSTAKICKDYIYFIGELL
ncbi:arginase [Tissierella sp. Yu-01]|uniref:arginase n=1 Tax=Tissierella sp. Yu-01 TaxID=3035694 RepID=UPI00240E425F|nr:arginase [Tissierella sp. Yu-01]WFA07857.1 arginase [Tissierella sp. Yu-01]